MGSLPTETGAQAVLIDPEQPERVYAAAETGLYRSDDAGQSWETVVEGLPEGNLKALALDPRHPQWLYAVTPSDEVYFSEDSASSWRALPDEDCL